jgi:hypothetical protein
LFLFFEVLVDRRLIGVVDYPGFIEENLEKYWDYRLRGTPAFSYLWRMNVAIPIMTKPMAMRTHITRLIIPARMPSFIRP